MNAPGYQGSHIHLPYSFIIRVKDRTDPFCLNRFVSIYLQLFLFLKASEHSLSNMYKAIEKIHRNRFPIFSKAMFGALFSNPIIRKRITHLSENISRDTKEIFNTLGTGRTTWFNKEMSDTISR